MDNLFELEMSGDDGTKVSTQEFLNLLPKEDQESLKRINRAVREAGWTLTIVLRKSNLDFFQRKAI